MTVEPMTEAQFARHRGVSRQAVMGWKRRGFLVLDGEKIAVERSDKLLDSRPLKYRGGTGTGQRASHPIDDAAVSPEDPTNWSTAESIRRKESALAQTRIISLERPRGNIILATDMEPGWIKIMLGIRTHMRVPSRLRLLMPHLSAADIELVRKTISDALRAASSDTAPPIADPGGTGHA